MIKKIEIGMGVVFIILLIVICITLKNKNSDRIYPSDVVYDFFTEMTSGNFEEAMINYLDPYKDNQLDVINGNLDLYKTHWANLGIEIIKETYNDLKGEATCTIEVYKYDITQIIGDVKVRLLNIDGLKQDGTPITEEELNVLKKQYIKEAYKEGASKYNVIKNTYDLKLISDDNDSYLIVNDNQITDILFGNASDDNKEELEALEKETNEEVIREEKQINDEINNDIIG